MTNKEQTILKVYAILEEITLECGSYQKELAMDIINLLEKELNN